MGSRIENLISVTRDELESRKRTVPVSDLEKLIASSSHEGKPFNEALVRPGLSVIAEHKRRSPSAGEIRAGSTVTEIVQAYERGGAAAISVLTDEKNFGGTIADLDEARAASGLPILAKNFHIDPYQLYESAAHGADAILIVVASVNERRLHELYAEAHALDLDVLVEVHNEEELQQAFELEADVIGINNRDLATFQIDVETTFELMADIPTGITIVAESGIANMDQIVRLDDAGVDAVLIGQAFMSAPDVEEACRAFTRIDED
ncbi:MAG: indole-3-glycerol phosphate synthase TrpC [Solirubrobacterales bacterium]